ncbi:MAG: hypothetical protein ACO22A_08050 [Schleiferiaceae bacterium]
MIKRHETVALLVAFLALAWACATLALRDLERPGVSAEQWAARVGSD